LELASPVLPEPPPEPVLAVDSTVQHTDALPVLPETPEAVAEAPETLPVEVVPSALAWAAPLLARMESPESADTSGLAVALPEPAVAKPKELELPEGAVAGSEASEVASPDRPPSPERPEVTAVSTSALAEVPVLVTSEDGAAVALEPAPVATATALESPLVLLVEAAVGLEVALPVSPELPPSPEVAPEVTLGLATAWPVLPDWPELVAVAPETLPVVTLPLALVVAAPESARMAVPELASTSGLEESLPYPAKAPGLAL
jgi:hypothetical protein